MFSVFFSIIFSVIITAQGELLKSEINMTRPKVLITSPEVPEIALNLLKEKFDLVINEEKPYPTKQQILDKAPGVDAIFWVVHHRLDDEVLNAAGPQLKVVATMSAGWDHIDIPALKKRNIPLGNTPKVLNKAVADTAILLTLAASKRFQEGRNHIEKGMWLGHPKYLLGTDLEESVVGIVGLGGIGQEIAKKIKAFDVKKILYTGHSEKAQGKQLGAEFVPLDRLLRESDFVIVAAPLTNETRNMFNETAFSKMKKTAVFVNIARGKIVDQEALIKALKNDVIFAAGLDVMNPEPLPTDSELIKLENCVLMPHLGSATIKTRNDMAELTARNIILGLESKPLLTPVY